MEPNSRTPIDVVNSYLSGYRLNNPRFGQLILLFSGYGRITMTLLNTVSIVILLAGGFSIVFGRFFNPLKWIDALLLIISLSILIFIGGTLGQLLFYAPYNANYVFGFSLLISFTVFIRFYGEDQRIVVALASIPFGFLAGLTNEHTCPAFLVAALLALILRAFGKLHYRLSRVRGIGFISFFIGYLALYFAPGQSLRYGSIVQKNTGIERLLTDFPRQMDRVIRFLSWESILFYVVAISLILAIYFGKIGKKDNSGNLHWCAFFLFVSITMFLTTAASPIIAHRLMFASHAALAFTISYLVSILADKNHIILIGLLSMCACMGWLGEGLMVYRDLRDKFSAHEKELVRAHSESLTDPVFEPYYSDEEFIINEDYLYKEIFSNDPNERLNRRRAHIYQLPSVRYVTPAD